MAETQRVYCTKCGQSFLTDTVGNCPLCRAAASLVSPEEGELHLARQLATRAKEPSFDPHTVVRVAGKSWRLMRLGIAAVAIGVLGGFLLFDSGLRGHKGLPNGNDLVIGGPLVLIAGAIAAFTVWSFYRK
jgi:hypothetical protein